MASAANGKRKSRRRQGDIEDVTGAPGAAPKDHNSQLTDEERRALTLHHKAAYEAADALVEKAKADRKAVSDLAKSDLGKGALADIKDLIAFSDDKTAKANIERALRLARWNGMPVATQAEMFDAPDGDRAAQEGMTAGMAGLPPDPPKHHSAEAHQRWMESWHEGQKILAAALGKKRPTSSEPESEAAAATPPPQAEPAATEAHAT